MGIKKLLSVATFLVAGSLAHTAWAQGWTDVTNGDNLKFESQLANPTSGDVFETWTNQAGGSFDLNQTVTNVPDGVYELSVNAMYRASTTYGTNTNCVLYANTGDVEFTAPLANFGDYTSPESLSGIGTQMKNNDAYKNIIGNIIVENGEAKIGIKSVGELAHCTNGYWFVCKRSSFTFKNVTESYFAELQTKINSMLGSAIENDAKNTLESALETYNSANVNNIKGLQSAISTYLETVNGSTPVDVTSYMANPSFEGGSVTYWYQDLGYTQGSNRDVQQPTGWNLMYSSAKVGNTQYQSFKPQTDGAKNGNCLYVRHRWGDVKAVEDLRQVVKNLPAGKYTLTVAVKGGASVSDANILTISEGQNSASITIDNFDKENYKDYSVSIVKENDESVLDICYSLRQSSGNEQKYYIDDFRLIYYGNDADVYKEPYLEAKDIATATLNDAKYENVIGAEKTALQAEIAKAEPTTADGYIAATTALTDATSAFINAAASYDAWVAIKSTAQSYDLAYASSTKKAALQETFATTPTTAEEAASATATITTALRAYVESNGMAEGVDGAVDYTSRITNASEPANNDGWTVSNVSTKNNEGWTNSEGISTHSYFDGGTWGATGWTASMKQDVTIPAGRYLLTAIARSSAEVTFTMSVGETTVNLPNAGNAGNVFDRGWNETSLEFTTPGKAAQETVTIQINATTTAQYQWFSIGNFRLVMLEATEIINASEAEYAALKSAIDAAEAKTLGFEAGEYAPYNNVAALKALAAAKAIDPASDNTTEVVVAATTALNNAIWTANETDVDAIYNGHFATVTEGDNYPDGWARTNGWGQMRTDVADCDNGTAYYNQPGSLVYGGTGIYTMPLAAETYYRLTFKYRSHEEGSNNGVTVSVLNGEDGLSGKTFDKNASTSTWAVGEVCFKTGAAGNYTLTLANNGNTWMTDVTLVKCAEATATMTITDVKYGTFIAPFDVEIPVGVTATKITGVDANGVTLVEEAVEGTIPANTPVLLYSETVVNETFTAQSVATDTVYSEGLLTGNLSGHYIYAPMDSYILLNGENGIGFYRVVSDDVKVNNNRVYLTVPAAEAKAFFSFGGGATGINGIEGAEGATEVVRYNAAGVKVNAPVKGLNIVKMSDGTVKKVMVK